MYKFGRGEKRKSQAIVWLPCNLGGKLNITLKVEMVEADIPLLLGNTTLNKAFAVINIPSKEIELLGERLEMRETRSGHFSVRVSCPVGVQVQVKDTIILAVREVEKLTEKEVIKLHHYWGHCHTKKLYKLIQNAGKMTDEVKVFLENINKNCESCRVNKNRWPRPVVSIPRATRHNEVVSLDLKEYFS